MEWPELDGDWWNLPAERAKNGLADRIPLNRLALDILERMAGIRCSTAVFPSTRYAPLLGRHMNPNTLGFAISRQMVFTATMVHPSRSAAHSGIPHGFPGDSALGDLPPPQSRGGWNHANLQPVQL